MTVEIGTTVMMEGVQIIFRNFTGKEGQYNPAGTRNFGVLISDDVAASMEEDGWNVKRLRPREEIEEGELPQAWLPVELKYRDMHGQPVRPARIVLITSRGRTNLGESEVEMLDWAEILNVDLIVRAFPWGPINGKSGVKAYLQSMYITINEDPLERKYSELDQAAQ